MNNTYSNKSNHFSNQAPFDVAAYVVELNERFGRLVKLLGLKNVAGTQRHEFEVEFAHALHEIQTCPPYLQGKRFDQAASIVNSLLVAIKKNEAGKVVA